MTHDDGQIALPLRLVAVNHDLAVRRPAHTMSDTICLRCRIRYLPVRGACQCVAAEQDRG